MSRTRKRLGGRAAVVRTLVPMIVALALLVLIIAWLAGTFEKRTGYEATVRSFDEPMVTEVVHDVTAPHTEEVIGLLTEKGRIAISAKVLATIEDIAVEVGSLVKAGDVLVELSASELEERLRQTQQALTVAVAAREGADSRFRHADRLHKENATPKQELDKATKDLQIAQSDVTRAEQAVREAKVRVAYATIKAPQDGRVVDRLAEVGDTAVPGEPLMLLYETSSMILETSVSEQRAVQLKTGEKLKAHLDEIETEIEATINEIVLQADAPDRSFLIKASIPNTGNLFVGTLGRLRFPAGTRQHLYLAPAAIQKIGQLEFVEVVLPNKTLERRFIVTGQLATPEQIEVLSGLEAGATVVRRRRTVLDGAAD